MLIESTEHGSKILKHEVKNIIHLSRHHNMTLSYCNNIKIQMVMEGEVPDAESSDADDEESLAAR